jgi:hypothetical protein
MQPGQWTEIFRAGTYGAKGNYTNDDLDKMVANFNASDQVPIVVGHPQNDAPAWGWISEVKRNADVLLGKVGELHKDFAAAIAEKKFKNRSVRILRTDAGPKLLHLGFLGAALPQVAGLKQVAQFGQEGECVDHQFELTPESGRQDNLKEIDMEKDQQIKKLQEDLAAEKAARTKDQQSAADATDKARRAEFSAWVDSEMVAKGRIATERKAEVVEFMKTLPTGEAADFSIEADGKKTTCNAVDWFKDFVKGLPVADFTKGLPQGFAQDGNVQTFSRQDQKPKYVDLTHKV